MFAQVKASREASKRVQAAAKMLQNIFKQMEPWNLFIMYRQIRKKIKISKLLKLWTLLKSMLDAPTPPPGVITADVSGQADGKEKVEEALISLVQS